MAAWINLFVYLCPLFVLLVPLWIKVYELDNVRKEHFVLERSYRRFGLIFLIIYLAAVAVIIFSVPGLLSQPQYHV